MQNEALHSLMKHFHFRNDLSFTLYNLLIALVVNYEDVIIIFMFSRQVNYMLSLSFLLTTFYYSIC